MPKIPASQTWEFQILGVFECTVSFSSELLYNMCVYLWYVGLPGSGACIFRDYCNKSVGAIAPDEVMLTWSPQSGFSCHSTTTARLLLPERVFTVDTVICHAITAANFTHTHTHTKFHRNVISGIPVGYDSSNLPAALSGHVIKDSFLNKVPDRKLSSVVASGVPYRIVHNNTGSFFMIKNKLILW